MSNKLDIPPELASLIEKREQDDRRSGEDRRAEPEAAAPAPIEERRAQGDRRQHDRRS